MDQGARDANRAKFERELLAKLDQLIERLDALTRPQTVVTYTEPDYTPPPPGLIRAATQSSAVVRFFSALKGGRHA